MLHVWTMIVTTLSAIASTIQGTCPIGWQSCHHTKSCYRLSPGVRPHGQDDLCQVTHGGHVADVTSALENECIHNVLLRTRNRRGRRPKAAWLTPAGTHLSLNQVLHDNLQWTDGAIEHFENWSKHPHEYGDHGNHSCVAMVTDTGQWREMSCREMLQHVCELDLSRKVVEIGTTSLYNNAPNASTTPVTTVISALEGKDCHVVQSCVLFGWALAATAVAILVILIITLVLRRRQRFRQRHAQMALARLQAQLSMEGRYSNQAEMLPLTPRPPGHTDTLHSPSFLSQVENPKYFCMAGTDSAVAPDYETPLEHKMYENMDGEVLFETEHSGNCNN